MRRLLGRWRRDARGGAIVEFALILPIMVLLEVGVLQLVQGFEAMRRVQHATFAMADVVAQGKTVTIADLDNVVTGGRLIMQPLPTGGFTARLASVSKDANGVTRVDWTYPAGTGDLTYTVPAGYLQPNESVIVADVSYGYHPFGYQPKGGWLFNTDIPMRQHAYLRPRLVQKIPLV